VTDAITDTLLLTLADIHAHADMTFDLDTVAWCLPWYRLSNRKLAFSSGVRVPYAPPSESPAHRGVLCFYRALAGVQEGRLKVKSDQDLSRI
jgi:hypothetical protein